MSIGLLSSPLVDDRLYLQISSLSSSDILSQCDVPGWSACIFSATPSDSRLWREGSPIVTNSSNISPPTFSHPSFSNCHHSILNLGSVRKSQIASKCLSGSDFFGQNKESLTKKVDLSTAENDLFVCGDCG